MTRRSGARRTLQVPGVGALVVDDTLGAQVIADPGTDPAEVDGLLRGTGQALLLQLRRVLPLHLAAVAADRRGAIGFVGAPGSGKSSLAAALSERGWLLVTDDIAGVRWAPDGRPLLEPDPPQVRIWGASARQLGWDTGDAHRLGAGGDKFAYDLPGRFASGPVPLSAVYVINPPGAARIGFVPILGAKRFDVFHQGATYNANLIDTPQERRWHFGESLRLAQRVPAWHLTQPLNTPLPELADAVHRHAGPPRRVQGRR